MSRCSCPVAGDWADTLMFSEGCLWPGMLGPSCQAPCLGAGVCVSPCRAGSGVTSTCRTPFYSGVLGRASHQLGHLCGREEAPDRSRELPLASRQPRTCLGSPLGPAGSLCSAKPLHPRCDLRLGQGEPWSCGCPPSFLRGCHSSPQGLQVGVLPRLQRPCRCPGGPTVRQTEVLSTAMRGGIA